MVDQSQSVILHGLKPLQASLRKASGSADKELKASLRLIGKMVLGEARSNAPTGPRPKRSNTPPLATSLRVSVTNAGVAIYSNAAHAYVIDSGGKVGGGAVISKASASGYLTKAIAGNRVKVTAAVEKVLDRLESGIHT